MSRSYFHLDKEIILISKWKFTYKFTDSDHVKKREQIMLRMSNLPSPISCATDQQLLALHPNFHVLL